MRFKTQRFLFCYPWNTILRAWPAWNLRKSLTRESVRCVEGWREKNFPLKRHALRDVSTGIKSWLGGGFCVFEWQGYARSVLLRTPWFLLLALRYFRLLKLDRYGARSRELDTGGKRVRVKQKKKDEENAKKNRGRIWEKKTKNAKRGSKIEGEQGMRAKRKIE